MDHNFVQLMCWLAAHELSRSRVSKNNGRNEKHRDVYNDIYDYICRTHITQNERERYAKKRKISDNFDDHSLIGKKIIHLYKSQYDDDGDGVKSQQIVVQFPNTKIESDFKINELIGRGGYGYVFKAMHVNDKQHYAIKMIELKGDCETDKILKEIRMLAKVRSLNTIQYFTAWIQNHDHTCYPVNNDAIVVPNSSEESEHGDNTRIVKLSGKFLHIQMELCPMTLKDAITKINTELNQRIGEPIMEIGKFIASQLFEEIVSGVQYLHASSILHRDLNPKNIFLSSGIDGKFIKIGDFGIATSHGEFSDSFVTLRMDHAEEHTRGVGNLKYMAPEVFNSGTYNEKSDIYSLACVACDLLCINWDSELSKDSNFLHKQSLIFGSSILVNMMSADPSERPSCDKILENKDRWLTEMKDINNDPLIYSIAVNGDKTIDRNAMNPLSHYIISKKIMLNKERDFESSRKPFNILPYPTFNWCRLEFSMEDYNSLTHLILSERFTIESNLDDPMKQRIIKIIKHAFTVHMSWELICDFIAKNVNINYKRGRWKCVVHSTEDNHQLKVINWKNRLNFHLYLIRDKNFPQFEDMKLFIYNDYEVIDDALRVIKLNNTIGDSNQFKIIEYNIGTTESTTKDPIIDLIKFVDDMQKGEAFTEKCDNKLFGFPIEHSHDLSKLRSILADERAFYYLSNDRKFLFYYNQIDTYKFTSSIECILAATIGELNFAVFTHRSNSELKFTYHVNNNDICEMRIKKNEPILMDFDDISAKNPKLAENIKSYIFNYTKPKNTSP